MSSVVAMRLPTSRRRLKLLLPIAGMPAHWALAFALVAYLNIHLGLRHLESQSLRWDESEQTLFSQQLALGYNDQPPVYTWLLWSVFRLTGVSLTGLYLLKSMIIAVIYLGLYYLAVRVVSRQTAALVSMSLLLTPYFAWSAIIDGAHTLLVAAVVVFAAQLAIRTLEGPTSAKFAILGLVLGFGFLAKYSFAVLALALPLAIVTIPPYRHSLRDPRILLTIGVAVLVVSPHAAWVLNHWELIRERPMQRSGLGVNAEFLDRVGRGTISLLTTTLLTIGSLVGVLIALSPSGCLRILTRPALSDGTRLIGRWLMITAGLLVVLVLLGVNHFRIHWLIPATVLLPAYMFARIAETPLPDSRRRAYIALIITGIVSVLGLRTASIAADSQPGGKFWAQDRMHEAVSDRFAAIADPHVTIIGDNPLVCGNLRLRHPHASVICTYYPAFLPAAPHTALFVAWDATSQSGLSPHLQSWLSANDNSARVDWGSATYAEMPADVPGGAPRRIGLARLLPANTP